MKKQVPNPLDLGLSIHKWGDKPAERRGDVISLFSAIVVIAFFAPFFLKAVLPIKETALAQTQAVGKYSSVGPELAVVPVLSESNAESNSECSLPEKLGNQEYEESWGRVISYCQEITSASEQYGIAPEVIAAIILIESGGDAYAISSSGATGLMQIMPSDGYASTFNCINGPCFSNRPKTVELLDPEFNINFGVQLLANYVHSYGDLREGLFHYGPLDMGYEGYADKVLLLAEHIKNK